jgi:hypothetical protein
MIQKTKNHVTALPSRKSGHRLSPSLAFSVAAIVMLSLGAAACVPRPPGTVIATSGVPSVSAAPPPQQKAAIGATLEVVTDTGTAAYTVANLQPTAGADYWPVKGTLYSVDVTIQTQSGNTTYNVNYFNARTEDGSNLLPEVGSVEPGLPYGDLPQGQKVAGAVAFDVPSGKAIVQIVLTDPLGRQAGLWSAT